MNPPFETMVLDICEAILDRLEEAEQRISVLEAKHPEELTFPPIDLGMVGGA